MKPLIIANWKMNPSNSREAFDLASAVAKGLQGLEVDVVLCPPFVYIPEIQGLAYKLQATSYKLQIGAQDCFWGNEGPYTGEVSPQMLKNLGCSYVILGHSERKYLGETLEMVNKKVKAALMVGLIPVVCIGEDVEKEIETIFQNIENWELKIENLVLVYEPEWAISTQPHAKLATPKEAQAAFKKMRTLLPKTSTLLYGGSVKAQDIKAFIEAGAQGALVGAASLRAQEFIQLAKNSIPR